MDVSETEWELVTISVYSPEVRTTDGISLPPVVACYAGELYTDKSSQYALPKPWSTGVYVPDTDTALYYKIFGIYISRPKDLGKVLDPYFAVWSSG